MEANRDARETAGEDGEVQGVETDAIQGQVPPSSSADGSLVAPPQTSAQAQPNWYCHECSTELESLTADAQCPLCFGSFVEIIDQEDDPREFDAEDEAIAFGLDPAGQRDGDGDDQGGEDRTGSNAGREFGFLFQQLMQRVMQQPEVDPSPEAAADEDVERAEAGDEARQSAGDGSDGPQRSGIRVENINLGPNAHGVRIFGGRMPARRHSQPSNGDSARGSSGNTQATPPSPVVNLSTFLQHAFGENYSNLGHGDQGTTGGAGHGARPEGMNSLAAVMQTIAQAFGMTGNPGDYLSQQGLDDFITNLMEQQDTHAAAGASKETIDALPRHHVSESDIGSSAYTECAICKDDFQVSDEALHLPCKHVFHQDCIIQWLQKSATCPVCRFILNAPASEQPAGANVPPGHTASPTAPETHPMEDLD